MYKNYFNVKKMMYKLEKVIKIINFFKLIEYNKIRR